MTGNNITYLSPFVLSEAPEHIYLCCRGIKWYPAISLFLSGTRMEIRTLIEELIRWYNLLMPFLC